MNREILKKQGVYAIRNILNGKMYIGSTTVNFSKRWQHHKKLLRQGIHHSPHLQSSWIKYGKENFSFEIIEITKLEDSLKREGYYIQKYETTNPKYGYNIAKVDLNGKTKVSESTKKKLSIITKQQWKEGKFNNDSKKGKPSWNKGLKCSNISNTRRNMFSSVKVYKNSTLIAIFRSPTDLDEWTLNHELPGITYYNDKANRANKGIRTTHLKSQNIHRAIRNKSIYRGLRFEKSVPLPPEMGVVKWVNCWKGEIPNQQPSQPLTKLEGSETNS